MYEAYYDEILAGKAGGAGQAGRVRQA
jgi:hypothetical protein